jgi:serine/threonine protein kinase
MGRRYRQKLLVFTQYHSAGSVINQSKIKHQPQRYDFCDLDFEILQFLGKGTFGKVYMARRK